MLKLIITKSRWPYNLLGCSFVAWPSLYVNSGICISTKKYLKTMGTPLIKLLNCFFGLVNLILLERDTLVFSRCYSPPINMYIELSFMYFFLFSKLIFLALYGNFFLNCFMTKVLLLFFCNTATTMLIISMDFLTNRLAPVTVLR